MRKIFKTSFFFLLLVSPLTLSAQEVLSGLQGNAIAEEYYSVTRTSKKAGIVSDTIELPFIDDFSDSDVEPKTKLWSDKYAFINSTYAIYPPTVGVATMDALNFDGSHYPNAGASRYSADSLTSNPINLSYPESDSIYLSFYYQPGGLAEMPEIGDSLILDFYSPDSLTWEKVWSVPGGGSHDIFKRVLVKIEDPQFLHKGFKFRFRNYASQLLNPDLFDKRANVDLWHLDYIKIDKNRTISDTVLRDVAFVGPIKSILKEYTSLPWTHFEAAKNTQLSAFVDAVIHNQDSIARSVGKSLEIRDLINAKPVYKVTPLYAEIASSDSVNYKYAYNYPFDFSKGNSAMFEIRTILHTDFFDYKANDTLRHIQEFYDYYALDDGTAEAGYGLRGSGTKDASVALKYNAFVGDTLRAIDMYFVQIVDSLNLDYYFYLNVWADNAGKPGEVLIDQIGMRPKYSDKLNKFVRYDLLSPVYIKGTFYIGFTQTVERLLNIGFDLNRANQSKVYYNSNNGVWTNSSLPGTTMMRPVFSDSFPLGNQVLRTDPLFSAWPNPADDFINIALNETYNNSAPCNIELLDITGRVILSVNPAHESIIRTSELQNGMYFLRMNDSTSERSSTIKIIINH